MTDITTRDDRITTPKTDVIEFLWLTYFNDTLFARGLISEEERNSMRVRIKERGKHKEQ